MIMMMIKQEAAERKTASVRTGSSHLSSTNHIFHYVWEEKTVSGMSLKLEVAELLIMRVIYSS